MVNLNISDQDIDLARREGLKAMDSIRAIAVRYLPTRERVEIELSTGWSIAVPKHFSDRTAEASDADCANIQITDSGLGLHWPKLDEDWYVPAVIESLVANQLMAA